MSAIGQSCLEAGKDKPLDSATIPTINISTIGTWSPMTTPESMLPLTPISCAVLLALAGSDMHGYALMKEVAAQSGGRLSPGTGTLYAALQRMIEEGLIEETVGRRGKGEDARRKYYGITRFGRDVARAEMARLARLIELGAERKLVPAERQRG